MPEAYIYDHVRTPRGRGKSDGALHEVTALALATVPLQALKELPYGRWREYNPEETVRFYALRLREAGMVKSAPQKLIAQGTDWRFLNELKKELKG